MSTAKNHYEPLIMSLTFNEGSVLDGIKGTYDLSIEETSHFNNIPEILRKQPNWIYLEPAAKPDSLEPKKPYLVRGVKQIEGFKPCNWIKPINCNHYHDGDIAGVAYVLTNEPIKDGCRIAAISITRESGLNYHNVRNLWLALGCPYIEHSLESTGWTIIGLIDHEIPTYEVPGFKITCSNSYIELCGLGGEGTLKDISDQLDRVHGFKKNNKSIHSVQSNPETPREIARLKTMLSYISADCSYEIYRNVVWAILNTGWLCAEQIALDWSQTAPNRYEYSTFITLLKNFDKYRSDAPTLGTIFHYARAGGWDG